MYPLPIVHNFPDALSYLQYLNRVNHFHPRIGSNRSTCLAMTPSRIRAQKRAADTTVKEFVAKRTRLEQPLPQAAPLSTALRNGEISVINHKLAATTSNFTGAANEQKKINTPIQTSDPIDITVLDDEEEEIKTFSMPNLSNKYFPHFQSPTGQWLCNTLGGPSIPEPPWYLRDLFPNLSQECRNLCPLVWSSKDISLRLRKDSSLTIGHLRSLYPTQWLTGLVIDEMLSLICNDKRLKALSKTLSLNADIFSMIVSKSLTDRAMKKLYKANYHLNADNLIIPALVRGNHWTLVIVNFDTYHVVHCDSLVAHDPQRKTGMQALNAVVSFLERLYPATTGKWTKALGRSPQQTNDSDCGIHVILNALLFAKGVPFEYPPQIPHYMRYRMVTQLVHGDLQKY